MSIDGIYNKLGSMMNIRPGADRKTESSPKPSPTGELAKLTDSASLSSVGPRLRSMLEQLSGQEGNVLEALENNVTNLQDGFLNTLHQRLDQSGISLDAKITLSMGEDNTIDVGGDHPDKERIANLIAGDTELKQAFSELASQSEVIRDIRNIRKVVSSRTGIGGYEDADVTPETSVYQVSLKGALSHFYFGKRS